MEELDVNSFIDLCMQSKSNRYTSKEFSDDDTYVLRAFKTAAQKKLFWRYICELGVPNTTLAKRAVFYYLNRDYKFVSNPYIFMCREKMQPSKWYYKINEPLPPPVNFMPKHKVEDLMYFESIGHIKLEELQRRISMPEICKRYDLSLYQMKNIRYRRLNPITNLKCFKILPPSSVVIKLREVINPDYWYIFPDELE